MELKEYNECLEKALASTQTLIEMFEDQMKANSYERLLSHHMEMWIESQTLLGELERLKLWLNDLASARHRVPEIEKQIKACYVLSGELLGAEESVNNLRGRIELPDKEGLQTLAAAAFFIKERWQMVGQFQETLLHFQKVNIGTTSQVQAVAAVETATASTSTPAFQKPAKKRKRGRGPMSEHDKKKQIALANDWDREHDSTGISKKQFADDRGLGGKGINIVNAAIEARRKARNKPRH